MPAPPPGTLNMVLDDLDLFRQVMSPEPGAPPIRTAKDLRKPENVVPMPPSAFEPGGTRFDPEGNMISEYEITVDNYLDTKKLNKGDNFRVDHPDGPKYYEFLGKGEGGRKDWMEIKPKTPSPYVS